MFSKLALFTTLTMVIFVAADKVNYSCNTGSAQCCATVNDASAPGVDLLLNLVGAKVGSVTGQVGANCSPITAVGAGTGSKCTQQPVCCVDNSYNGAVALGCTPVAA
ncbi:fungal hydrophobin [Pholiota conissans]|uniref:Hydrophobin n=1 Tax=Pholiota conissans TaxID=109636 RepID=A0A9P5Z1P3_9AGAR|nr:fungal hydrophobin [Pholiota conissans]